MVLLYKSYYYINKQKLFLNEARVVGRGTRGEGVDGVEGVFEIPTEVLSGY